MHPYYHYYFLIFFIIFSQFLNDNFDYDESTALEQLSAFGLKNFMFDVAKVCIYTWYIFFIVSAWDLYIFVRDLLRAH